MTSAIRLSVLLPDGVGDPLSACVDGLPLQYLLQLIRLSHE